MDSPNYAEEALSGSMHLTDSELTASSMLLYPDLKRGLVTLPSGNVGATDRGMNKNAYPGQRFPPAIIQVTVWMYARVTLSFRDVGDAGPCHSRNHRNSPCAIIVMAGRKTMRSCQLSI